MTETHRSADSDLPPNTTQAEYIERWEQALRVLEGLSAHEREYHFNMGIWGKETPCGTVACLAGHCSLDPWFQSRGFTSEFKVNVTDGIRYMSFPAARPEEFFGDRGEDDIFTGPYREYDEVVQAVKEHIAYLKDGGDPNLCQWQEKYR